MKRIFATALVLSLAFPAVALAQQDWDGMYGAKTKAVGWKASMVRVFDESQLTGSGFVEQWLWTSPNTIQSSDCTFDSAAIQSKAGKDGKFQLSGLSCPDRASLPSHLCVEVVGISGIARFENTKKEGIQPRPCDYNGTSVYGNVTKTRNVAVLCPVDAAKGSVKCSLPPVAQNPCVDAKGKPSNDINTQVTDAVVYDNNGIIDVELTPGTSLATCDTAPNIPMGRIGTFINAK